MSKTKASHNRKRQEYVVRLREARNNFLKVFYEENNYGAEPKNIDFLSILIIQNLEILEITRRNDNGGGN